MRWEERWPPASIRRIILVILPEVPALLVLRVTNRLRRFLGATPVSEEPLAHSDTALGDWYVTRIVVDRRPLLVAVSANGYLPLIAPARHLTDLAERFPELVAGRLKRLHLSARAWFGEVDAMEEVVIAPTGDRVVNGVLTRLAMEVPYHLPVGAWNSRTLAEFEDRAMEIPWHASQRGDRVVIPENALDGLFTARWGDDDPPPSAAFLAELGVGPDSKAFPPSEEAPDGFPADIPFIAGLPGRISWSGNAAHVHYQIASDPMEEPEEPISDDDLTGRFADLRLRTESITSPYGPLGRGWNLDQALALVRSALAEVEDEIVGRITADGWVEVSDEEVNVRVRAAYNSRRFERGGQWMTVGAAAVRLGATVYVSVGGGGGG